MEKFCSYCGKELSNGELCNCPDAQRERNGNFQPNYNQQKKKLPNNTNSVYNAPSQNNNGSQIYNVENLPKINAQQAKNSFGNFGAFLKMTIFTPQKAIETAVENNDMPTALISAAAFVVAMILMDTGLVVRLEMGEMFGIGLLSFLFCGIFILGGHFVQILVNGKLNSKTISAKSSFIAASATTLTSSLFSVIFALFFMISPMIGAVVLLVGIVLRIGLRISATTYMAGSVTKSAKSLWISVGLYVGIVLVLVGLICLIGRSILSELAGELMGTFLFG